MAGYKVVALDGNTLADTPDPKKPWTEDEATHRMNRANADAEALGIVTRYKVVESK